MAAGFEAKARITADVSQFVQASREAARAAGTFSAAVRALRNELQQTQRSAASISNMSQSFAAAANAASTSSQRAAQASQSLSQGMQQSSSAFSTGAQSAQQYSEAANRTTQNTRITSSALRSMGREMETLTRQQNTLAQVQRQNGRLSADQASAYNTISSRLRELNTQYNRLNADQQAAVNSARSLAQAQQTTASSLRSMKRFADEVVTSQRELDRSARQAAQGTNALDGSLFSIRSVLWDVEIAMRNVSQATVSAFTSMWDVFSRQEAATARLSSVTQSTNYEIGELAGQLRNLSESIPIPFDELARIGVLGAQTGVATRDLAEFTETVALFAATTDVAEEEAAMMFSRIQQMTDIDDSQTRNLGAAVSELGANSAATEGEILKVIESIATVGNQADFSGVYIAGLGSAMASLRIQPELARGALQRIILEIGKSAQGAAGDMEKLSEVMGMSAQEIRNLYQQNPEEFFLRFMESLNGVQKAGGELIPTIRELGIINTRDADVTARLAQNYELLEQSVNQANRSFQAGTYLHQESERIFTTLTARVQILSNQWENFLATMFQAIAPVVGALVDIASAVLKFTTNLVEANPIIAQITFALGAFVAILGTVGVAVAASVRGWVAMRQAMTVLTPSIAASTAATTASTAATTAQTVAVTGYTGALARATAASRAFALAHPVGAILLVAGALGTAALAWDSYNQSAEEANQAVLDSQQINMQAAGGLETLQTAIQQDTEAWNQARKSAVNYATSLGMSATEAESYASRIEGTLTGRLEVTRNLTAEEEKRRKEAATSAQAELEFEQAMYGTIGALQEKKAATEGDTSAIDEQIARQRALQQTINENTGEVQNQTVAIGAATLAWIQASNRSALLETELLQNQKAMELLSDAGFSLGEAMAVGVAREFQNAGDGAKYFGQVSEDAKNQVGFWDRFFGDVSILGIQLWKSETVAAADDVSEAFDYLSENLESSSIAIEQTVNSQELLSQGLVVLGNGAQVTVDEFAELDEQAKVLESTFMGTTVTIEDMVNAFTSFNDPLQIWKDLQSEANTAAQQANEAFDGIANVSLPAYAAKLSEANEAQRNWANNLLFIAQTVPPEVVAQLTSMGTEGAAIVQQMADAIATGDDSTVDQIVREFTAMGDDINTQFALAMVEFIGQAQASGDTSGYEFVSKLMEQVNSGEITMEEAVDRMTSYAETEFAEADPVIEAQMDNTQAINQLSATLLRTAQTFREIDSIAKAEPDLDTTSFWDKMKSFASGVIEWAKSIRGWLNFVPILGPYLSYGVGQFADGGWVSGPGGSRQDKIPAMLSDNEFVVNARSAKEFGPLLEWINGQRSSGSAPVMAPNFIPDDILTMPRRPLDHFQPMPMDVMRSNMAARDSYRDRIVLNINNQYPQAEPTSTTVNRALAYAGVLDGLS
jgi:TP901 family phage tail tape measure protein